MRILIVTNIPSLYRNVLFNKLNELFPLYKMSIEVWFMAKREPNRHWIINENDFKFKHTFFSGLSFPIIINGKLRMFFHITPKLWYKILTNNFDCVIIGGAYSSPNHVVCSLLMKKKQLKLLWTEGNNDTISFRGKIISWFKKYLTSRFDFYIGPGQRTKVFLESLLDRKIDNSFILLPNIVDDTIYNLSVKKIRNNPSSLHDIKTKYGIASDKKVLFTAARLEYVKALDTLINSLDGCKNVILLIAGEGSLETQLKTLAKSKNISILFLGNIQQDAVVDLLSISDIFALTSISDPNPLSIIEAIGAGLPILISPFVGNFDDVFNNKNGWVFNPKDSIENLNALMKTVLDTDRNILNQMGIESEKLYLANFSNEKVVVNFINQFNKITNNK